MSHGVYFTSITHRSAVNIISANYTVNAQFTFTRTYFFNSLLKKNCFLDITIYKCKNPSVL